MFYCSKKTLISRSSRPMSQNMSIFKSQNLVCLNCLRKNLKKEPQKSFSDVPFLLRQIEFCSYSDTLL